MDKLKSRKLGITIFWCSLIPLGLTYSFISGQELSFMSQIVTYAGICSGGYIGMQGMIDNTKEKK
jgi:hypothetical protein